MDEALLLARETDAVALARYASARVGKEATVRACQHPAAQDLPQDDDASREISRLRTRVEDLESLLSTIRRLREKDFERAAQIDTANRDATRRES